MSKRLSPEREAEIRKILYNGGNEVFPKTYEHGRMLLYELLDGVSALRAELQDTKIDAAWEKSGVDMIAEAIDVKQERDSLKAKLARAEKVIEAARDERACYCDNRSFFTECSVCKALAEWEKEQGTCQACGEYVCRCPKEEERKS